MGAQLAAPGKVVIDIDGDASFLMTMFELPTIAEYNIPVKIAILNNDFQGMIKQWQDLFYDRRYAYAKMKNPNFAALAEACGIKGMCCKRKEDVAKTVEEMPDTGSAAVKSPIQACVVAGESQICRAVVVRHSGSFGFGWLGR